MSKKVHIDDLFKERLEDYASPTPVDLWASLEANLKEEPPTRKQRPFWLLMTILLFLFSAIGFGFYSNSTNVDNQKENDKTFATEKSIIASASISTPNRSTAKENNIAGLISDKKTSHQRAINTITNLENDKNKGYQQNNNANKAAKKYKANGKTTSSIVKTKNTKSDEEYFNLTPVYEERQESFVTTKDQQSGATNSNKKNLVFDSSLEKNTPRFPVVPLFELPIKTFPRGKFTGSCPKFFKIEPKPTFYLELLAGSDYALRLLSARNSNEVTYVNIRKETENFASAYSFGGRVSVAYETGFVWRIGLMYNRLNEKINLIGKPGYEHIENVEILNQNNTYQFVDVPLLFGYQTNMGKINWSINTGAYFNLFFKSPNNFILDENREPLKLDDPSVLSESPVFKGQVGISFYSSLSASYSLTDNLAIIAEPNLRIQTQSLTLDSYPLEQRYINIGLLTGLRFKF